MHLSSDVQIPDGLLAANALLAENSRQGFETYSGTVQLGFGVAISSTAIGISGTLYDSRIRSRSTGKERDSESGLDYFGARYYASSVGRWMSPDWADKPEAVPYSSLDNPQSLNLYGYVGNNPLSKADPDGHEAEEEFQAPSAAGTAVKVLVGVGVGAEEGAEGGPAGEIIGGLINGLAVLAHEAGPKLAPVPATSVTTVQLKGDAATAPPATGEKTGEPPQLAAGKEAHKNEEVRPGEKREVPTPSGTGRMDRYNSGQRHIREIKPDNARGEKAGRKALERYKKEMDKTPGKPHTTELTKYPIPQS